MLANINAIKKKGNDADKKEEDLLTILEVVFEMNKRGIELLPVDLYKSKASQFIIEDGKIRPPFSSVAGVGANAAIGIAEGAKGGRVYLHRKFSGPHRRQLRSDKGACGDRLPERAARDGSALPVLKKPVCAAL